MMLDLFIYLFTGYYITNDTFIIKLKVEYY